ncbi:MAG TPA: isoprenylcysteine carboxylmethyltransferase family protein [Acidobacteriaceae bacterium]|jgi:protein-S-isoprenylcysteine O-methyltransferase Ste14
MATERRGWQRIARRARVPLGFVVAAVFLVFARPSWTTLAWGLVLIIPGLWLRAYAAGYVKKNAELTRTGPYAYTRNPLYLGSMAVAFGFAVAAGQLWLAVLLVVMFLAIYVPTILSEEQFLRGAFPQFQEYADRVPRLLPRLTPARFADAERGMGRFSRERYLHHREYNASIGAAALYAALIARMWLYRGHF